MHKPRLVAGWFARLLLNLPLLSATALLAYPRQASAEGRIVVSADDWVLTDNGFAYAGQTNTGRFATNLASWFMRGATGKFLTSPSFGAFGSHAQFASALINAGHTWTRTNSIGSMALPGLLAYDALFLGDAAVDNQLLAQYVRAGGSVYVYAIGYPTEDAARWNGFLSTFGLSYGGYGPATATYAITNATHPLFAGVNLLYFANGTSVTTNGDPGDPRAQVLTFDTLGHGLFGVYDPDSGPGRLGLGLGADGKVVLSWEGTPNISTRLWTTGQLGPPIQWSCLATNVADGIGRWQFTDPDYPLLRARFYRVSNP